MGLSEADFWQCSVSQYWRLAERHARRERQEDYRAGVLAALVASAAGAKNVDPSRWFPSLRKPGQRPPPAELRREDLPADWKVTTGAAAREWAARFAAEKAARVTK